MDSFKFFCLNPKIMKQKKLLSFGITLLLGLSQLFAQKQNPVLVLKSGDWFEAGIRISNAAHTMDNNFELRYEVSGKMPDGNLIFKVSINRMKLKCLVAENTWSGYDSYYPPYLENSKKYLTRQIYEITADSHGKILKLKSLSAAQKISFSLFSTKTKSSGPKIEFSTDSIFPAAHLKQISETIISSLIAGKALAKTSDLRNSAGGKNTANAVLKLASFKFSKNALIKGKITNLAKADTIYAINDDIFRFSKDGSFSADVLAGLNSRRRFIFGEFDNYKTISVLLTPLDTLIIKADARDFDNTVSFTGNAAAKASLTKELVSVYNNQWVNSKDNYRSKSPEAFLSFQKQGQKDFDDIINKYTNRVSSEILNHCRTDFKYIQGGTRLTYLAEYRNQLKPNISFEDFPKEFFLKIDTISVSMSYQEGDLYYDYYIRRLSDYQKTKLGLVNGERYRFFTDFASAMASFEGYPLYYSISESFKKELHKSDLESTERLKNYYEDFIHNCGDTSLTNRITELWTKARQWSPGNPSPVNKLLLKDGSIFDLAQFKGKPLVLILNDNNPDVLKDYIDLIKKQNGSQVHFVIVQLSSSPLEESTIVQKLKDLGNVTYVELSDDKYNQINTDIYYRQTKVFTFNSDFRVISGYLFSEETDNEQVMQELIKKAIDSSVMTKEQKASLINIIEWSICSALLTSIVIFLVYRARINGLRKKTLLMNKIKDLEIKAIRSQMNPHFMFNALNSIQSLINDHQYKEANVYLEKFSLLMRRVLNNSEKTFVTLSDELDAILLYCELEQLRFNFKFEIKVSAEVNTRLVEIPGMIIQPLVENSILHGLAQKGAAGRLVINVSCDQRHLKIVIKDNGTGLKENITGNNKSFGLKLVRERLALLSADENIGNLHLSSNLDENDSGVTAVLTIPID